MNDYLTFRKMITPVIIQILFWIGVAGCVIAGLMMFSQNFLTGLITILVGPIVVRIYCEIVMVVFSINDTLTEIKNK